MFAAVVFNEKHASEANSWLRGRTLCAPALVDLEVVISTPAAGDSQERGFELLSPHQSFAVYAGKSVF